MSEKTYKISERLMNLLVDYFMYDNTAVHDEIVRELDAKLDAMVKRANYAEQLKILSVRDFKECK